MSDGTRTLVVTTDRVGEAMAGPGIRAYELARLLADDGHDVVLTSPFPVDRATPGFRVAQTDDETTLRALVGSTDVVVGIAGCLHHHPWIGDVPDVAVVIDAYDPTALEALERHLSSPRPEREGAYADALAQMVEPLRWADLVLCASPRQRDLLVGILLALGRINPDTYAEDPTGAELVAIVPFGLPDEPPVVPTADPLRGPGGPAGPDDLVLLWAGGVYDWLDPLTLVEALPRVDDHVVAVFPGLTHPTPGVGRMAMAERLLARARALDLLGSRVHVGEGWVPYDERAGWLLGADVGVSLHGRHLETAYAFRTRMLDHLWTTLPVICSDGDAMADLVAERGLGRVVPPGDPEALAEAIRVMDDPDQRSAARRALTAEAPAWTWPHVARPLRDWCREPRRAADRRPGAGRPAPAWLALAAERAATHADAGAPSRRSLVRRAGGRARRALGSVPRPGGSAPR